MPTEFGVVAVTETAGGKPGKSLRGTPENAKEVRRHSSLTYATGFHEAEGDVHNEPDKSGCNLVLRKVSRRKGMHIICIHSPDWEYREAYKNVASFGANVSRTR